MVSSVGQATTRGQNGAAYRQMADGVHTVAPDSEHHLSTHRSTSQVESEKRQVEATRAVELGLLVDRWRRACEQASQFVLLSQNDRSESASLLIAFEDILAADAPLWIRGTHTHHSSLLGSLLMRLSDMAPKTEWATLELDRTLQDSRLPSVKAIQDLIGRVEALCIQNPTILVLEGLRQSDVPTLDFLDRLMERVPDLPLLVLITCRQDFLPPWKPNTSFTRLQVSHGTESIELESIQEPVLDAPADDSLVTTENGPAPDASFHPTFDLPKQIGPYRLEALIGRGGMGEVFRAFDGRLRRSVALKQIRREAASQDLARRRFRREARLAARLDHPGIVKVYDVLEAEGCDWIVMELVEGQPLNQRLTTAALEPSRAIERAISYAREIAAALAAAHENGIVHRDLKARNVFVTPGERLKILDFGLAKDLLQDRSATTISGTGQVVGTPQAMSPEQAMGRPLDLRSDLFSLGSLIYEMASGISPFRANGPLETLNRICLEHPLPLREVMPESPRALSDLIDRLLEKDPNRRPRSVAEVALALGRLNESEVACQRQVAVSNQDISQDHQESSVLDFGTANDLATRTGIGSPIPENKRLTVLCCELVHREGCTESLDPELLFTVMEEFEHLVSQTIYELDGHLVQTLSHQGVAYFGFPRAREDDVLRASLAAERLLQRCQLGDQLGVRIGLHTGPAVVAHDGRIALGKTWDRAAALLRRAAPNEALLSDTTYGLCEGVVNFQILELEEANLGDAARLLGFRAAPEVLALAEIKTPMVARQHELALLQECWSRAQRGQGQVVLVTGEAGIGKSRLIGALLEHLNQVMTADGRQGRWLGLQAASHAQASPYYPIFDWLQQLIDLETSNPHEKMDRLEILLGREADSEAPALIGDFLGLPITERYPPLGYRPELQKKKTHEALTELLLDTARQQPMVLVVEDLHWLDPSSLELLSLWVQRSVEVPLLLLLSSRPSFIPGWAEPEHLTHLEPTRLTLPESTQLLDRLCSGKTLPQTVRDRILEKTDGVPLFLEEMVGGLLETGRLIEHEQHWELVGDLDQLIIPATLQDLLVSRLDRLGAAKKVAQSAAVIGREFTHKLLTLISGMPGKPLEEHLERLVDAGVIYRKGYAFRRRYQFKHALIQDAAYESLPSTDRRDRHAQIATALETHFEATCEARPDLLGSHWLAAERFERCVPFFRKAGDHSKAVYANEEASTFYNKALKAIGQVEDWESSSEWTQQSVILQEGVADLMTLGRQLDGAKEALAKALALAGDSLTRARIYRKRGRSIDVHSRDEKALEDLNRAEELLQSLLQDDRESKEAWQEWIRVGLAKAMVIYRRGDLKTMQELTDDLAFAVERHGTPDLRADFLDIKISCAMKRSRFNPKPEVLADAWSYLAASEELGEKVRLVDAYASLGFVLYFSDHLDQAQEWLEKCQDLAIQVGDSNANTFSLVYLSLIARRQRCEKTTQNLSAQLLNSNAPPEYLGIANSNLAWIAWREGRTEETEEFAKMALKLWEDVPHPLKSAAILPLIAVSLRDGDRLRATALLEQLEGPFQKKLSERLVRAIESSEFETFRLISEETSYL